MEGHDDPMIRDGKRLALSQTGKVLPRFLLTLGVALPVWACTILPAAIAYQAFTRLPFVSKKKTSSPSPVSQPLGSSFASGVPVVKSDVSNRKFDLILFGASGFTGGLAAKYLAKNYGGKASNVKWAIAGRRKQALEQVRDSLLQYNSEMKDLPIMIADTSDAESLASLVKETKVIISTVGPFHRYGTPLVQACVRFGTSYCDITGEVDWVQQMTEKFDDDARVSGARIVHFCGHDCVPWDLCVMKVAEQLKKKGEALAEVSCYDEVAGAASGGTIETIFSSDFSGATRKTSMSFDPMMKTLEGTKSTSRTVTALQNFLGYSSERKAWVGPNPMATIMAVCVRRSNALNSYGARVIYKEAMVFSGFMAGFVQFFQLAMMGTALALPPFARNFVRSYLPKPGEGPSESQMDKGFLKIVAIGTGDKGGKSKATIYFPTDPGYRDTARMLVESGLALALDKEGKISKTGGVFTPSSCQKEVLLERLIATGCSFHLE